MSGGFAMLCRALFPALCCLIAPHQLEADTGSPRFFDGLLDRSPFGIPETKAFGDVASDDPLEFRGILEEKGGPIFSVYETASRRSTWVDLKSPANGISVKTYDDATTTITVVYHKKLLTLPLKGGGAWVRSVSSTPTSAPQLTPTRDTSYHDQPFRIGHVAEEAAIRRAVRQPAVRPNAPVSTQR